MSAQTIERVHGSNPTLPRQRTGSSHLRLLPDVEPVRRPVGSDSGMQLTRRGRIVVLVALMAVGVAVALALTGPFAGSAPGAAPGRQQTRTIVVQPGQTLWSIARDIAPTADRRTTIARIVQLNGLPGTDVAAGTRLAVPTR